MVPVPNREEGQTLKMMSAISFVIFIMTEAFICASLLVALVTPSLWQSLSTHTKAEQRELECSLEESQNQAGQAGSAGKRGQKASVKPTLEGLRFGGPLWRWPGWRRAA